MKATDKISARAAAVDVLEKEGGPLKVKEVASRILAGYKTGLKGKTPDATIAAQIYTAAKNGVLFKVVDRGTVDLIDRDGGTPAEAPAVEDVTAPREATPDPKPQSSKRGRGRREPAAVA